MQKKSLKKKNKDKAPKDTESVTKDKGPLLITLFNASKAL